MTSIDRLNYLEITFGAETDDLVAVLMRIVHGFNASNESKLGVDFPDWTGEEKTQDVSKVRVFGEAPALAVLASQIPFKRIALLCGASLEAKPVPAATNGYVRLSRANSADRQRATYVRRLQARAERRGADFSLSAVRSNIASSTRQAPVLEIAARSASNGNVFNLKVNKEAVQARPDTVLFNAYGLCKEGAVPAF